LRWRNHYPNKKSACAGTDAGGRFFFRVEEKYMTILLADSSSRKLLIITKSAAGLVITAHLAFKFEPSPCKMFLHYVGLN